MNVRRNSVLVLLEDLRQFCKEVLIAAGSGQVQAAIVAEQLVEAEVAGRRSHGVHLLKYYLREIEEASLNPQAVPSEERICEWAVRIRGHRCFGQCAAVAAVDAAIRINGEGRPAFIAIVDAGHIGRLQPYVRRLADAGSLAVMTSAFAGTDRESAVSAYPGGRRVLGTNPIAISGPGPFAIDVSTAETSVYEVLLGSLVGFQLRRGAIVDSTGTPSVSPQDYLDGGAILPAGKHKGLALSIASLLVGALSGSIGFGGTVLFALPVSAVTDIEKYSLGAAQIANLLATEAQASGGRTRVPGVRSTNKAIEIQLSVFVLRLLGKLASRYSVPDLAYLKIPQKKGIYY